MHYNREKIIKVLESNGVASGLFGNKFSNIVNDALDAYEQKHRYYHNISHLCNLFGLIDSFHKYFPGINETNDQKEKEILQIVALFHDVIYDPRPNQSRTNEELSAEWFCAAVNSASIRKNKSFFICECIIKKMILETQYGKKEGTTPLSKQFNEIDLWTLIYGNLNDLLKNEMLILKEYQFSNYPKYKEGRIKFLNFIKDHPMVCKNSDNISLLLEHVRDYVPSIGIYAGSFNPFHIGHQNILEKAGKLFDKVIIAVGNNPDKDNKNICAGYVSNAIPFYEVNGFYGALSEYIKSVEKYAKVTLVRGLRNGADFSYEVNQLRFIEDMKNGPVSVVFIPCDRQYDYVSSSAIRSIGKIGGDFDLKYLL